MEGRSSWMSDMVWIISRPTAVGLATSMEPPNISQAAKHSIGRTRFPPAISEYRIDSTIKSVSVHEETSEASNAASVYTRFSSM
jgi:hypothetical protein